MLNQDQFTQLLRRYLCGVLPDDEKALLFREVASGRHDPELRRVIDLELQHSYGEAIPAHLADEIYRNIISREVEVNRYTNDYGKNILLLKWAAAAVLILSLSIPLIFGLYRYQDQNLVPLSVKGLESLKEFNNTSDKKASISLPDGTFIEVYPHASVKYSTESKAERMVILEGDAFFRVTRDTARPFYVYCKDIITKVLGTSFEVLGSGGNKVEVTVRSGKVQVYHKDRDAEKPGDNRIAIIMPNQRLSYEAHSGSFEVKLAAEPLPVRPEDHLSAAMPRLRYATPVALRTIAEEIGDVYGVQIIAQHEDLYKCLLSGDLSRANLYEKMDMICLSINATYEVNGTVILIKGKGCGDEEPHNRKPQLSYFNQN